MYIIRHEVAEYHPSENEYISLSGEYLIKPQENARWRVMRYKGGLPPLMIYTTSSWWYTKPAVWIKKVVSKWYDFFGGGSWIWTSEVEDNRFTVCPLWPLGNTPIFNCCCFTRRKSGAGGRTRTPDLLITNQLLYQLSYTSTFSVPASLTSRNAWL